MTDYFPELDDHPLEVRRGFAQNALPYWPKVQGFGNVVVDGIPTYSIFKPSGELIAQNLAAIVQEPVDGASILLLAVNASDEAVYELKEFFRIDITWAPVLQPGMVLKQNPLVETIRFSSVRVPYTPRLSLNDFVEEMSDARQFLEGQAQAMGERTADQHASVLVLRAWTEVHRRFQTRLRAQGRIYPRLTIDQQKIDHAVIAQALHVLFRSEGGGERERQLAEDWKAQADQRFVELGDLPYDDDEDGVEDSVVRAPVSRRLERRW